MPIEVPSETLTQAESEAFLRHLVSDPISLAEVTLDAFKDLRELRTEVARLRGVLDGWEQNQREAVADAYDEGYTDATEFRPHRNTAAILAVIDPDDERNDA